jgi:hypothetical protein
VLYDAIARDTRRTRETRMTQDLGALGCVEDNRGTALTRPLATRDLTPRAAAPRVRERWPPPSCSELTAARCVILLAMLAADAYRLERKYPDGRGERGGSG